MKHTADPAGHRKRFQEQVRENPRLAAVYFILRLLVLLMLVAQILHGNFENAFLCVLTLFLFTLPSFLERAIRNQSRRLVADPDAPLDLLLPGDLALEDDED